MLNTIGIIVMAVATLSLAALAIDTAFRHGGEGALIALGLGAGATVPAWVGASMAGVAKATIASAATAWIGSELVILGCFGAMLLWRGQREGMMCLGIAVVMGAALYAVVPGYVASARTGVNADARPTR